MIMAMIKGLPVRSHILTHLLMGIYTTRLLTRPTEKAVNPAIAP